MLKFIIMFAICIESSHKKGMGHFYRGLNLYQYFKNAIVFVNDDAKAISLLKEKNIPYAVVDFSDIDSGWESGLIRKYGIKTWINDHLDTHIKHSENIKKNNINLITFDDEGEGASLADLNICALPCRYSVNKGRKILKGIEYLVLNPDIKKYKRQRTNLNKIIVTLGGSDTYGVTLKVAGMLKKINKKATIVTGPSFEHGEELENISNVFFEIKTTVPNLIEEFYGYDLAITGGGMTPFEANSSGLPCIIVASELQEIENAQYLDNLGSSIFAGYRDNINTEIFTKEPDIEKMSKIGMENIKTNGVENIYKYSLHL